MLDFPQDSPAETKRITGGYASQEQDGWGVSRKILLVWTQRESLLELGYEDKLLQARFPETGARRGRASAR